MTQKQKAIRSPFHLPLQRTFLLQGLSWMGGIGILSSGVGLAQNLAPDAVVVPSAQDLLAAPSVAPAATPPVVPEASLPAPASRAAASLPISSPSGVQPELIEANPLVRVAPSGQSPLAETVQPVPAIAPPDISPANETPLNGIPRNNAYIDTTDYSIGATNGSNNPSSVVLSERSTGCQIVLQQGQSVPSSVCAARRIPVANPLNLGNQQTSRYVATARIVNVGPVRVSVGGFSPGRTTPSGRDYYNRTLRPLGRLGNGNVTAIFPLSLPTAITSAFGWRIHPITGDRRLHSGTDLGAPLGTPVLAAYAGRVAIADFMQGYGLTAVLQHSLQQAADQRQVIADREVTEQTLYAHMSELFVRPGEWVEQGAVIGRVGSTGNSTGPHLHFEFRQMTPDGWQALDPGQMLEYSLAQLVQTLQIAQANPQPFAKQSGFSRAIAANRAIALRQSEAGVGEENQ
jgi:murein DD-endopeptidase MepM/ murein hydrolase activator NlpD